MVTGPGILGLNVRGRTDKRLMTFSLILNNVYSSSVSALHVHQTLTKHSYSLKLFSIVLINVLLDTLISESDSCMTVSILSLFTISWHSFIPVAFRKIKTVASGHIHIFDECDTKHS